MKQKSDLINKLLNESIESRIEEITKQLETKSDLKEVDDYDLEVGSEYKYRNKTLTFLKRGKTSRHTFWFEDDKGNEIMFGPKTIQKMEKKINKQEETEGNAFTKKLKDTPKGEKFKMGNKEYTDNSSLEEMLHSELEEKLHGGQKKLDKNHNGKIDAEDFKMLRKGKKSEMDEDLGGMEDSHPDFGDINLSKLSDEDKKGKFAKYYNPLSLKDKKRNDDDSEDFDFEEFDALEESDKKFIQKATKKMEKKGTEGSFKKYCGGQVTMDCIEKAMDSGDSKLIKKANFAKNIKAFAGAKHKTVDESVVYQIDFNNSTMNLSENELVDMIEELVVEQKSISKGMTQYNKISKKEKDINKKALKDVEKKMSDYVKAGSKGKFEMNPKIFPKGNGELGEMDKKAYQPSDAVSEYIENFAYAPGMENLSPDEIGYNEDWVEDNIKGSSRTGNSPKYANAVETELGEKIVKKHKDNLYKKEKDKSYNRVKQPVDVAGQDKKSGKLDDMFKKLGESEIDEKQNLINEEMNRMKNLLSYTNKKI
jgi:hypothetical protein